MVRTAGIGDPPKAGSMAGELKEAASKAKREGGSLLRFPSRTAPGVILMFGRESES